MWEIFAYQNSDALFGVFNAVAAIMGAGTYLGAIAAVAFCGFVAAMVAYMFAPERLHGWKWLGSVVLVYGILFVPRVTVGIVDKTGGSPVKVVANVPFGMAVLGGLTSTIGNALTEVFETAFQVIPGNGALPAELAYQQNGLMFGSRVIQATRSASLPDPSVRVDLINFIGNCTAYDVNDGTISPSDFSKSPDLWGLMASTNPARFTPVTTASGLTTMTCTDAYANIGARMNPQVANLTTNLALQLNPTLDPAMANAAVQNQITQAYIRSQIADASATAADLVRQNALINAVNDAADMGCQRINDPSCMMLAAGRAQATASQNAAWINGAKISEQALPIVRNVAEALCYALFPLIVLLLFVTAGRATLMVLNGYIVALISIQLWPPLYAVLNYMATIYAQSVQGSAADIGAGLKALSIQTASPIYSNSISAQAVVSYLIIGIPALSYALANRLVNLGGTLFSSLSGLQSTVGNASASAAVGNASMGNVSMDQRIVSPSTSSPWVSREQDASGNWVTTNGTGQQAIEFLRNAGPVSNRVSASVSESAVKEASKAVEAARSDVLAASKDRSAALTEAVSHATSGSLSTRSSSGEGLSSFEELGKSADRIATLSKQVAATTGLSTAQVQQIAFELAAGVGTPKALSPVKLEAGGSAGKTYSSNLSDAEQKVRSALGAEGLREFKQFGERATHDQSFIRAIASESRSGSEVAARLATTTARSEAAQASLARREAVAERISAAHSSGQDISVDLAQLPINSGFMKRYTELAAQYGPESQALAIAMASELANYSTSPQRHFSDGSALPTSFDDVLSKHQANAADTAFSPSSVDNANRVGRRTASRTSPQLSGPPTPSTDLSNVRRDVNNHQSTAEEVERQVQTYEDRNQITQGADGTKGTKKSLAVQNVRQMKEDVLNMGRDAKEALNKASDAASEEAAKLKKAAEESEVAKRVRAAAKHVPGLGDPKSK